MQVTIFILFECNPASPIRVRCANDNVRIEKVVHLQRWPGRYASSSHRKKRGMAKSGLFQGSEAIAEAARDKAAYTGFTAGLFEADVRWNLFSEISIPEVSPKA